jgi:site-specific DNA-methyltransferase (adenine-specific)
VPKKTPAKPKPLYRRKPPKAGVRSQNLEARSEKDDLGPQALRLAPAVRHPHFLAPAHFELREDGSIGVPPISQRSPRLVFSSDAPFIRLYHGNCLELLDAIAAKYPDGRFDCIFADPPYFLSNGGITCHAGKMVKVDKGDWDKSRGPELNHEFNLEWLRRCQRVLKPNGTIWVSGTHHVIFSIGYAMQQLGYKILNDIAWEKPNPPPNLSCRYFTHSTETILWAAKSEKSKHIFNYQEMRRVTGRQMKTVWRREEFSPQMNADERRKEMVGSSRRDDRDERTAGPAVPTSKKENLRQSAQSADKEISSIWTLSAPGNDEKSFGKHPTQKPVALVERCLLASTNAGDLVLDPFLGGGTTAVACVRLNRGCVGIELDEAHVNQAEQRVKAEIRKSEGELFK